jgi:hypothetical protein
MEEIQESLGQKNTILPSVRLLEFRSIGTSNIGFITVADFSKDLPFDVKRAYWTYYTPHNVLRGGHAHKRLQQVLVAVSVVIQFDIEDRNEVTHSFRLESPSTGLYVPPMCWRTIRFSHNAVLLCLADSAYEESDYIRDYGEFKRQRPEFLHS